MQKAIYSISVWLGDQLEIVRNLGYPTMFQKTKMVTGVLGNMSENLVCLNAMAYATSEGAGGTKKGGSPKMEGYPTMCMKLKGGKNAIRSIRRC
jgi:hypothetical protein